MELSYELPSCPHNDLKIFAAPSSTLLFILSGTLGLLFSLTILVKYNSVSLPVVNRKISNANISNSLWIVFFSSVALRGLCDALRFGDPDNSEAYKMAMAISSTVTHGLTALFLSFAMNYQKKYRSGEILPEAPVLIYGRQNDSVSKWRQFLLCSESGIIFLSLVFAASTYLYVIFDNSPTKWIFYAANMLQRLPVLLLVVFIGLAHQNLEVGPTRKSKFILLIATLLYLPCDLPLKFWAEMLPSTECLFMFASFPDLMIVLFIVSIVLYFIFMRAEFLRNQEEFMFTCISHSQDNFDFRRF